MPNKIVHKYHIVLKLKHKELHHYDFAVIRKDGTLSMLTPVRDSKSFYCTTSAQLWLEKHVNRLHRQSKILQDYKIMGIRITCFTHGEGQI